LQSRGCRLVAKLHRKQAQTGCNVVTTPRNRAASLALGHARARVPVAICRRSYGFTAAAALVSNSTVAKGKRIEFIPESVIFRGSWAPSTEVCEKAAKSMVTVSATTYSSSRFFSRGISCDRRRALRATSSTSRTTSQPRCLLSMARLTMAESRVGSCT